MGHQHLGAAVGQHVGDFLGLEVPVDRHGVGADPYGGERGLQECEIVAQQQRGAIAAFQSQCRESRGGARNAFRESSGG